MKIPWEERFDLLANTIKSTMRQLRILRKEYDDLFDCYEKKFKENRTLKAKISGLENEADMRKTEHLLNSLAKTENHKDSGSKNYHSSMRKKLSSVLSKRQSRSIDCGMKYLSPNVANSQLYSNDSPFVRDLTIDVNPTSIDTRNDYSIGSKSNKRLLQVSNLRNKSFSNNKRSVSNCSSNTIIKDRQISFQKFCSKNQASNGKDSVNTTS